LLPAKFIYDSYIKRTLGANSFDYTGSLTFEGSDFLSALSTNMTFQGALHRTGTGVSTASSFNGIWAGHSYTGQTITDSGELYFYLNGPVMPVIRYKQSSSLFPLVSRWYKERIDESLYDNVCEHATPATLQGKVALYKAVKSISVTPSPFVNYLSFRNSIRSTHISGWVNSAQLPKLWEALHDAAPAGCDLNTIGLNADDTKHVSVYIDLYSNHSFDELVVTLNNKLLGAKSVIGITTSNYNGALPLKPAPPALDLNSVFASTPSSRPAEY
jgi:hypothetical protein